MLVMSGCGLLPKSLHIAVLEKEREGGRGRERERERERDE